MIWLISAIGLTGFVFGLRELVRSEIGFSLGEIGQIIPFIFLILNSTALLIYAQWARIYQMIVKKCVTHEIVLNTLKREAEALFQSYVYEIECKKEVLASSPTDQIRIESRLSEHRSSVKDFRKGYDRLVWALHLAGFETKESYKEYVQQKVLQS